MTDAFQALVIRKTETGQICEPATITEADLMDGDVTVAISHSTVNYKDGLAVTGRAPIARRFPLIPGIDFAGTVTQSTHPRFTAGDAVLLNGFGVGETHHGGFAARARVNGDWLIHRPAGLSAAQTMAIGTAGYTAMLCVMALEAGGLTPANGDILVTGAAGGVGSIAVALLARAGFRVLASSRRAASEAAYLKTLGAADIIDAATLAAPGKPFAKERWAGVIDSVGSHTLANALAQTRYNGVVAACGLAQGSDLPTTVLPFILRGVTLTGIDSVMAPRAKRETAWARLATELDLATLEAITTTIGLAGIPAAADAITTGQVRGRIVVAL
ncbi:MAG: oxidoreductase [Acidiphilium sp. 37-64-53]|nr:MULTISPECIES: MDR family oxidoreductase [Acidiphilium]OYW02782.1 MAG: oxidoreductase [Acidiphilium sp. 37-64-53]HQT84751.1 MDR family oxidoreductase [Acidiphilium rubrum]